jgi:hypothetical protein
MNQESSSDRLAFQVAHTTISPNYPGEEFETLDRQILVVFADVPCKMEKPMSNVKSVKTPMLPEPSGDNKSSQQLPQVQATNRLMPDKSTPTPGNKHLRHQLLCSSDAEMIHLVPTDCACGTSLGTSSVMDSKSTTHRRPTWELLLPL